jgi:hypothetical protein
MTTFKSTCCWYGVLYDSEGRYVLAFLTINTTSNNIEVKVK